MCTCTYRLSYVLVFVVRKAGLSKYGNMEYLIADLEYRNVLITDK